MAGTVVIDAQHPWPWLDAFPEKAASYFNGRDDDVAALLQAVASAPVTVLFGRSGLGKTSLLQAGLFPQLGERRLFPVLLRRVDHGPGGAELSARWLARLDAEAEDRGLAWQGPLDDAAADDRARLWERLHRADGGWRDKAGARWTPLLVLDQFEEVFTLQSEAAARRRVFEELGDLFENRIPPSVAARIEADESLLDALDLDVQPYRCLLALREDFLAELETWVALVPRLAAQRLRLLPMKRAQALEAVLRTGGALVDEASADRIVAFLAQRTDSGGVEPALLSLVCASLNEERLDEDGAQLDVEQLETSGARILDRFYDQAFAALPEPLREPAHAWVESELITAGGTRRPYPRQALAQEPTAALETLVQRRLLRVENAEHGDFVELVHDRLAAVAAQRAAAARERAERVAAEREKERTAERRRRFWRSAAGGGAVLLVGAVVAWWLTLRAYNMAETSLDIAERAVTKLEAKQKELEQAIEATRQGRKQAQNAEQRASEAALAASISASQANDARLVAEQQSRAATAFRLAADGQNLAAGVREGGPLRALLSTLAGYRLAQGTTPEALAAAQAAMQSQAESPLVWVHDAPSTAVAALSPDGKTLITGGNDGVPRLHDGVTGEWIGTLPLRVNGDKVTALAISSDGAMLVSGHRSGALRRWDLKQRRELNALPNEDGAIAFAAVSGDQLLVVGAGGSAVRWNLKRDEVLARWSPTEPASRLPRKGRVAALSANYLAIAGSSSIDVLDARTLQPHVRIGGSQRAPLHVTALMFGKQNTIVTGSADGEIRLWDEFSGAERFSQKTTVGAGIAALHAISNDDVLVGTTDGRFRFASLSGGSTPLALKDGFKVHAAGAAWTMLGDRGVITTVGEDRVLTRWRFDERRPLAWRSLARVENPRSISYSPDGRSVVAVTKTGLRQLPIDGSPATTAEGRADTLGRACYSGNRRWAVATALGGPPLRAIDVQTGRLIASSDFDPGFDAPCAISENGERIAIAFGNRWQLFDARLAPLGPPVEAFAADADITALVLRVGVLVAGTLTGDVARWDLATRRRLEAPKRLHEERVQTLAISPDGRWLASASYDRRWRLSNLESLVEASRDSGIGHGGEVLGLAFSRDGRYVATSSGDATLRLWTVPAAMPLGQPLRGDVTNARFGSIAFAPDGRSVATTADGLEVLWWPVLDAWADAVCKRVASNMSRRQWRDWVGPDLPYVVQCPGKPEAVDSN